MAKEASVTLCSWTAGQQTTQASEATDTHLLPYLPLLIFDSLLFQRFSNHLSQFVFIMNGYLLPELLLVWSLQTMKRSRHIQAADLSQASWGNNQTQDLVSDCGYQRQGRLVDLQTAVPWQDKCPTTTERARHSSQGKGSIRPDLPLAANLPATSRRTYTQT